MLRSSSDPESDQSAHRLRGRSLGLRAAGRGGGGGRRAVAMIPNRYTASSGSSGIPSPDQTSFCLDPLLLQPMDAIVDCTGESRV